MKLAINGGSKFCTELMPYQTSIGEEEKQAVIRVMESKQLSSYRGSWNGAFLGGVEVQAFEKEFSEKFGVKHSVAVNSCTSALQVCIGAVGINPGAEVLVSPWSMICSATAPFVYGGVPVFCDIERENYCLDFEDVKRKITPKTKAIIVVSLFGNPYDQRIYEYAKERGIYVIDDCAQCIGGMVGDKYSGNLADLSCFSFTQGKTLNCGESGIITTNNEELAFRCQLIRNHFDSVTHDIERTGAKELFSKFNLKTNPVGFNMRMTELHAAIMREQLKKLDWINAVKIKNANYLMEELVKIPAIRATGAREDCKHVHYVTPFQFDSSIAGVSRNKFINAVKEELQPESMREVEGTSILIGNGYIDPLYIFPIFRNKGYGEHLCPVCEDLWENKVFTLRLSSPPLTISDLEPVVGAFKKVYDNISEIK